MMWRFWVCLAVLLGLQAPAFAGLQLPVSGEVSLGRHWDLLHDPDKVLRLDQILQPDTAARFQPQHAPPHLGYREGAIWLRVTVNRPAEAPPAWWLELKSAILDDVTLYFPDNNGNYIPRFAGDRHGSENRDVRYRHPVFILDLPAQRDVTFYLRIASTSTLSFPLLLWSADAFATTSGTELLLFGFFYAIYLVVIGASLWFYRITRNTSHGLFSMYALANMLNSLTTEGFAYQYFLHGSPAWNEILAVTSWFLAIPIGVVFVCDYLGLYTRRLRRPAKLFSWFCAVFAVTGAALVLVAGAHWLRPIYLVWGIVVTALVLVTSAVMAGAGSKPARIVVVVQGILLAGLMLRTGRNLGLIEPGVFVDNAYYIGMVASLLLLNSAISWRYEELRREKEAAQAEALRVSRLAERELEEKVAARTRALQEVLAKVEAALNVERRAHEEQRQFMATVSHELRTPLTVIDVTAQNLELDAAQADPLTRARYEKILRATQRLSALLDDSLDEDRFELLRRGGRVRPVSLKVLLADAVRSASVLADGHQFEVIADGLPGVFHCDGDLLRLVLRSLADNAVKYTPPGSRVILQGQTVEDGVVLEISDNGPGIPPADLPHVFERYYRGQNGDGQPGTGLGLALARQMIQMQDGALHLDSGPQGGCRVRIFLPAHPPAGHTAAGA